jgi:hypothetical protein
MRGELLIVAEIVEKYLPFIHHYENMFKKNIMVLSKLGLIKVKQLEEN